jgi:hypothetical protein
MKPWYSDMYANVDAMRLDEFVAGLTPDVEVVVGNNPAMKGGQTVKEDIGHAQAPLRQCRGRARADVSRGEGRLPQERWPAGHRSRGHRPRA